MPEDEPIHEPGDLRAYYQQDSVAEHYVDRRFVSPMTAHLHQQQVNFIQRLLDARAPRNVLEIAPGPARVTRHLRGTFHGLAVDSSEAMLEEARKNMAGNPDKDSWQFSRGDAFNLPSEESSVDFVYTLRLIRHFRKDDRMKLYGEIQRVLRPGGTLCFDAVNKPATLPYRRRIGVDKFPIYDVAYDSKNELKDELAESGLHMSECLGICKLVAVQDQLSRLRRIGLARPVRALISLIDAMPFFLPGEWIVACRCE